MGKPLIIHSDESLLKRYQIESRGSILTASSISQAIRMIGQSSEKLSSVIFSPHDASVSPSRFIETLLIQRPMVPVFIFEPSKNVSDLWLQDRHIQGAFTGQESLSEMLAHLKPIQDVSLLEQSRIAAPKNYKENFTAIPIVDLLGIRTAQFDLFIENEQKETVLLVAKGGEIEESLIRTASQKSPWVFISNESISSIQKLVQEIASHAVSNEDIPSGWRIAEVLFQNKANLTEMRKAGVNDALIDQTLNSVNDVFLLLSHLRIDETPNQLKELIRMAKSCDRTVAATTLSMLMCKALKFEKNSVIEILGVAGMLQDISLYQSPFGNLAETSPADLLPEAQSYYQHHPIYSADIASQHTTLPEVVLQVIRQHHERKDRTGFPNRVGGIQLHPMAEILSLINAYLDSKESGIQHLDQEIFHHYSDRIVGALKSII